MGIFSFKELFLCIPRWMRTNIPMDHWADLYTIVSRDRINALYNIDFVGKIALSILLHTIFAHIASFLWAERRF